MITRFAPSPTGPLHLGHAFSAILSHDAARAAGGRFHLRLDDLDQGRSRPEWALQIAQDLRWLGLRWDGPIWRQSRRMARYAAALDALWARGLLYPCHCSRRDIAAAVDAPQEGAPILGPDGLVYPGTCRPAPGAPPPSGPRPRGVALRLDMARALALAGPPRVRETGPCAARPAPDMLAEVGDVVLARREMGAAYHLAIVLDDADQGVTCVMRGADLYEASFIHAVLQQLLGLPQPEYRHHRLIRDAAGKRLAKRDDARAIATYRAEGATPQELRAMLAPLEL